MSFVKADPRVNVSRPDGRPEVYQMSVPPGGAQCVLCAVEKKASLRYRTGEIFLSSPIDAPDGQAHFVCKGHLPDDVVIVDPEAQTCRDKEGWETWSSHDPSPRPYTKKVIQ